MTHLTVSCVYVWMSHCKLCVYDSSICVPWLIMTHYDSLWLLMTHYGTVPLYQNHEWLWSIMTHLIASCVYMTHSYVCLDSLWLIMGTGPLSSEPWLIIFHYDSSDCKLCVCDSFICVPWLMNTCDMTHSYVFRDAFICVPWLIHMCALTHWYVWHDSSIRVSWRIHMCAMTHPYVCLDSLIRVTWLVLYMHMHTTGVVSRLVGYRMNARKRERQGEREREGERGNWCLSIHKYPYINTYILQ